MARAMKASGGGAATKRRDRRQAKFRPGPGPDSVKPIGVADAPEPAAAPKAKKSLGKLSKKRKAEGGLGGGGGEHLGAGEKKKKKTFVKRDDDDVKHKKGEKKPLPTKKEHKEWAAEQKALTKPNHSLITEMVGHWERLRSKKSAAGKKMSADERAKLVDAIFKASKGKVPELANNHKGSRVIQALLKYGTETQKRSVYEECTPAVAELAKSLYGHFLVKKLIDETAKKDVPALLQHVKGKVRALAKHPVGSQVLESLYFPAPPAQRLAMRCEFYGSEFAFFGAGGADTRGGGGDEAPRNLREAMRAKPAAQRQGMLRQMNAALLPILEKGLVSPSLVHAALAEYLEVGGPGTKHEAAQSLAGPAFLRMIHTREGAHAANLMFAHAGAKQRKAVLKALKGQVGRIARDEHAAAFLACALECTDDTKLAAKAIVAELRDEGVARLADDRAARRVLLHMLRPRSARYVHPHVLATMPDPAETARAAQEARDALAAGGHFEDEEGEEGEDADEDAEDETEDETDDEMMDDEFLEDEEDDEAREKNQEAKVNTMSKRRSRAAEAGGDDMDDDDDDDDDAGGGGESMDFGVSRKNPEARRREIFGAPGHLGRSLVAACVNGAGSMLRSATASDVLFETCSGGAGGAVAVAVGDAQMRELHDAVAEAARASVAGENIAETLAENPAGARDEDATLASGTLPRLPLHEDYFSTRTLRRMVLEISGDAGDAGDGTAPSFAAALWEGAVSRDVAAWIGGHGAKVVAAIVKSGDAATRKACIAALTKALPKGQSPTTWAEGFFRQRAEGTKETKETKETKKAPETKARASSKTPAPGQKKTSKSADENAATPSAARVSKSPKDKKFSPRLTRAQRSEKAAKGKK
jgi:pumilio family protein 6